MRLHARAHTHLSLSTARSGLAQRGVERRMITCAAKLLAQFLRQSHVPLETLVCQEHLAKTTQSMATMLAKPPCTTQRLSGADVRGPTAVSLKPPSFPAALLVPSLCPRRDTDPSPSRCAFDPDGQQLHIATGTVGAAANQVPACRSVFIH
jgi:hypothetical protein